MKNNWISIEDKLPEKQGLYLVVYRCHPTSEYFNYGLLAFIKLLDNKYGFKWENCGGSHIDLDNYIVTQWAEFEKYSDFVNCKKSS